MSDLPDNDDKANRRLSRRKLLGRIGLAAGAAYMAPVMLSLSQAHASTGSAPSRASRPSRPSRASAPSAPSRPSRPSAPSGPSRPSRPSRISYREAVRRGPPPHMTWQQWQAWLQTLPR